MNITDTLTNFSAKFNGELGNFFLKPTGEEKRVIEAMEYSVLNGGKRLRPFLVHEVASMFNVGFNTSLPVGVSLEMLHSYSLIHDDLPAMDNDDLRRGKPTCHKQFDEATAILAGDGLLTRAFEVLSASMLEDHQKCELIKMLSTAAGAYDGMIAGQMLDLYAEQNPEHNEELIKRIEKMKTGRLLLYACEAGAVLGNANQEQRDAIASYAVNIGLTFQISDDILDACGDQKTVGKTLRKDKEQGKVTFVTLYGLPKAKELEQQLTEQAKAALRIFGDKACNLNALADFIIARSY